MNLRREPTYLTSDVWKACLLIARHRSTKLDSQGLAKSTSVDEIATELIRSALKEHYPRLLEYHKLIEKQEEELVKSLDAK